MCKYILALLFVFSCLLLPAQTKPEVSVEFLAGYAAPINESYIDTFQNSDIYWNPNSGLAVEGRMNLELNENFTIMVPLGVTLGYYRYTTTDGRKVNTEAQAGNAPETVNTEWSISPDLGVMVRASLAGKSEGPYMAVGIAAGLLHSWETWKFINSDDDPVTLYISKSYDPTPVFKGEFGWNVATKSDMQFNFAVAFDMVNYIMRKVILTHYFVNGTDQINQYDEKSTVYNYSFNAPDENKGGDCLLAGFTYNNYPQQKISSNLTFKIGIRK